jgi:hypothetical protein
MHLIAMGALFALQCFHVLFLALHDWIPLNRFGVALPLAYPRTLTPALRVDAPPEVCIMRLLIRCQPQSIDLEINDDDA